MQRIVRVAVPVPLHQLFDYAVPEEQASPVLGARVAVPFGRQQLVGVCVALNPVDAHKNLKPLNAILDTENLFGAELWELAHWLAEYYQHPLGEVLATILPAAARKSQPVKIRRSEVWQVTGESFPLERAPKQAALFQWLLAQGGSATAEQLRANAFNRSHIRALAAKGAITQATELNSATGDRPQTSRAAAREQVSPRVKVPQRLGTRPQLNAEQQQVLQTLNKLPKAFAPVLLDGITGSGKTEIYLRFMEEILAGGKQVLVLVPEIALTPQTLQRFEQRFGAASTVHSNMTDTARLQTWLRCRNGEINILIGTRSAVLTPFANLGLIVVDEEHDSSFKQTDGLRYSARDLAVKRAQQTGIPLLLGSATPSFESLHNARSGRYRVLHLTKRAGGASLPSFHLIDIRGRQLQDGVCEDLSRIIERHLTAGGQTLVFLNRRGFAPTWLCAHCGWQADCDHCERHMTLHRQPPALICHHCGHRQPLTDSCPQCQHIGLIAVGVGTQRTEAGLARQFPDVPLLRIDRDTTRSQRRLEEHFATIRTGRPAILVGTQMLAKGHHFPDVTLVAVINADGGFMSPDFRAPERTAQLIVQVAGRAGRAQRPGEVYIQTYQPENPLLQALLKEGYPGFAERELEVRAKAELPPYRPMALIRAEASQASAAQQWLAVVKTHLRPPLEALGPAPAIIARVADRSRYQLMVTAANRPHLHRGLKVLKTLTHAPRDVRWVVDIDPYDTF